MKLSNELLNILVCPKCKGKVELNDSKDGILCYECCLIYKIKEGIPIMIIEKADKLKI